MVLFLPSEVMFKTGPPRHLVYFEVQDLPIQLAILVFLCNNAELIIFFGTGYDYHFSFFSFV